MHHHHQEHFTPKPQLPKQGEVSINGDVEPQLSGIEAFKKRILAYGEKKGQLTQIDELKSLYDAGEFDKLDSHIDDLVYEALTNDEEFMDNIRRRNAGLNSHNLPKEEEQAIRTRQNELFNEYKRTLVSLSGLPDSYGIDEYEASKERVKNIIEKTAKDGHAEEVLTALGILTIDKDGKEIFTYPRGLFPAETDKKWDLYLDRVREDLRVERGVQALTLDPAERKNPDLMRRLAHDTVARDVDTILGLDRSVTGWDFEKTRNLLAKMRDSKYPTVETAEKDRTTDEIIRAANILGILGTRLSDMNNK